MVASCDIEEHLVFMSGSPASKLPQRLVSPSRKKRVRMLVGAKAAQEKAAKRVKYGKVTPDHTSELRTPIVDFNTASAAFGVNANEPVPQGELGTVIGRIAADSIDLFGTLVKAKAYLETTPITRDGVKARDLAKTKGIGLILARLDDLRFGSRG